MRTGSRVGPSLVCGCHPRALLGSLAPSPPHRHPTQYPREGRGTSPGPQCQLIAIAGGWECDRGAWVPISPEEALSLPELRHPPEILLIDLIPTEFIYSSLTLSLSYWELVSWGKWCLHVMPSQWRDLYLTFLNTAFSRAERELVTHLCFLSSSSLLATLPVFRANKLRILLDRVWSLSQHGCPLSCEAPSRNEPGAHAPQWGERGLWAWVLDVTADPLPLPGPKILSLDKRLFKPKVLSRHTLKVPSS